jgi:hypothetical protein
LEFKQGINSRFRYLYPETNDFDEEESTNERKLISDEEAFAQEFGWYKMLYLAANEDYTKINTVIKSNAQEFLMFCNFYVRKTKLDNKRINANTPK